MSATLLSRLAAASGMLLGIKMRDSAKAVDEAAEIIRALPYGENINAALYPKEEAARGAESPLLVGNLEEIRQLRQWHYAKYLDRAEAARKMQKRSDSRMFKVAERDDFEIAAQRFQNEANQHLKFVRVLNAFFSEGDRVHT